MGEVLGKAAAKSVRAIVTVIEIPELQQGIVVRASPDHVVIELDAGTSQRGIVPLHHASLTVWVQRRPYTMLCVVQAFEPATDDHPPRLRLSVPTGLSRVSEQSVTYRVPVEDEVDLRVYPDPDFPESPAFPPARPFNLGPTGLQLRFTKEEDPGLKVGQEIHLRLALDGVVLPLPCLVSRVEPRRYELFLTSAIRGREVRCPDDVLRMVHKVQRAWLEARRRKADGE